MPGEGASGCCGVGAARKHIGVAANPDTCMVDCRPPSSGGWAHRTAFAKQLRYPADHLRALVDDDEAGLWRAHVGTLAAAGLHPELNADSIRRCRPAETQLRSREAALKSWWQFVDSQLRAGIGALRRGGSPCRSPSQCATPKGAPLTLGATPGQEFTINLCIHRLQRSAAGPNTCPGTQLPPTRLGTCTGSKLRSRPWRDDLVARLTLNR